MNSFLEVVKRLGRWRASVEVVPGSGRRRGRGDRNSFVNGSAKSSKARVVNAGSTLLPTGTSYSREEDPLTMIPKLSPRRRASRGFSLIEIMIVVAIILVIASIAIPKINQQRMQAHEMAAVRTVSTIQTVQ